MGHEQGLIPVSNGLSDEIAKELKAYGFKYLGTVTVYSISRLVGSSTIMGRTARAGSVSTMPTPPSGSGSIWKNDPPYFELAKNRK